MSTRTKTSTVYLQHCGKSVSPLPIALLCFGFCIFVKNLFDHQTNFNIRKLFMNASIFYHLSGFGSQAWAEMPRISIYRYIERYSLYIKMYNIFFLIKSVPGYEKWSLEEEIKSLTWVCIMWFFFFVAGKNVQELHEAASGYWHHLHLELNVQKVELQTIDSTFYCFTVTVS